MFGHRQFESLLGKRQSECKSTQSYGKFSRHFVVNQKWIKSLFYLITVTAR